METLTRMPFAAQKAIFDRLGSIAEIEAMDEPERSMYDESLRVFRDNIVVAKGEREAGREEGREEATITIAKKNETEWIGYFYYQ